STDTYTLSLHDALPILLHAACVGAGHDAEHPRANDHHGDAEYVSKRDVDGLDSAACRGKLDLRQLEHHERIFSVGPISVSGELRSEEHTSELQSPYDLV